MCGATAGGLSLDGVDVAKEAVVQGQVVRDGEPVPNAYVRLLDRTGEFRTRAQKRKFRRVTAQQLSTILSGREPATSAGASTGTSATDGSAGGTANGSSGEPPVAPPADPGDPLT